MAEADGEAPEVSEKEPPKEEPVVPQQPRAEPVSPKATMIGMGPEIVESIKSEQSGADQAEPSGEVTEAEAPAPTRDAPSQQSGEVDFLADIEDLASIPGITEDLAHQIKNQLE